MDGALATGRQFSFNQSSTWEKFVSVCGGHLISMNFPPRNLEGYYGYLKV
jgi:hypothetical protein